MCLCEAAAAFLLNMVVLSPTHGAALSEIKTSSLRCLLSESLTGVTRKGNVAAEGGGGVTYYQWERSQTGRGNVYPKR